MAEPESELGFFMRLELGVGPRGFGPNNALLDKVGYPAIKSWYVMDAAYMISQRWGLGVWAGLNRRSGDADRVSSLGLNVVSYFVGVEAPVSLWGQHDIALHVTPRVGFLSGQVEFDNARNAASQQTAIFGAGLHLQSFLYHFGGSIAYTYAPAGSPGELGGNHDYGGLYVALTGTIDG